MNKKFLLSLTLGFLLSSTAAHAGLDDLPTELQIHVAKFVSAKDLGKLTQVSSRFHEIAESNDVWREELSSLSPNMLLIDDVLKEDAGIQEKAISCKEIYKQYAQKYIKNPILFIVEDHLPTGVTADLSYIYANPYRLELCDAPHLVGNIILKDREAEWADNDVKIHFLRQSDFWGRTPQGIAVSHFTVCGFSFEDSFQVDGYSGTRISRTLNPSALAQGDYIRPYSQIALKLDETEIKMVIYKDHLLK